jgi:hypothetical protein
MAHTGAAFVWRPQRRVDMGPQGYRRDASPFAGVWGLPSRGRHLKGGDGSMRRRAPGRDRVTPPLSGKCHNSRRLDISAVQGKFSREG